MSDLLHGTTGHIADDALQAVRRIPHVTVVFAPTLAQVGACEPLVSRELALDRGVLAFGGEPLADRLISREQGLLRATAQGTLELVDHGSRHGTWLNGRRLEPRVPTHVGDGDRIALGRSLLYVQELPHDPDGWERDVAIKRMRAQHKDRESQRLEERAIADAHERLAKATLVGTTPGMRAARRDVLAAARLDGPVLVSGPTGTGKEAVAGALHAASARRRHAFVAFSCAEVAPNLIVSELFGAVKGAYTGAERDRVGLWRSAARGTLFLDEVGDAPLELQAALLRAIESGTVRPVGATDPIEVDVRLVAATKRELESEVQAQRFRDDLLYRLAGTHIRLPALGERPADAILLFARALARFGLSEALLGREALEALWSHRWPGNGREVVHLAERVAADATPGAELALPADFVARAGNAPLQAPLAGEPGTAAGEPSAATGERPAPERQSILEALERNRGNLTAVAREFGVRRQQVYRWVERFGIALEDTRKDD